MAGDPCLGRALQRLRGQRTLDDVALAAGIEESAVAAIESGDLNPMWTQLVRLASALDIELHALVDLAWIEQNTASDGWQDDLLARAPIESATGEWRR